MCYSTQCVTSHPWYPVFFTMRTIVCMTLLQKSVSVSQATVTLTDSVSRMRMSVMDLPVRMGSPARTSPVTRAVLFVSVSA